MGDKKIKKDRLRKGWSFLFVVAARNHQLQWILTEGSGRKSYREVMQDKRDNFFSL